MDVKQILDQYKEQFKEINAFIYTHNPNEEIFLLRWWMHLQETGDIKKLIKPSSHSVDSFFHLFSYPTTLIYSLDKDGEINNAAWVSPDDEKAIKKTAYSGAWTREDTRGTKLQYKFIRTFYSLSFEFFDSLLGITWQKELLDLHIKLGYTVVGCIPDYYDQPYCYIIRLTGGEFKNSRFYKVGGK